jgi:hypothetical protein
MTSHPLHTLFTFSQNQELASREVESRKKWLWLATGKELSA